MLSIKHYAAIVAREMAWLLVALIATYIASMYLVPWYVSPDMSTGMGQTGWPVAYWMKTWLDLGNNKGYEQSTFDFLSLALDIGLFYLLVNCLELLVEYTGRRSRRENNPLRLNEWIPHTAKRMAVLVLVLFLIYVVAHTLFTGLFGPGPAQAVTPK